ncbi:MAG: aspartate carbamoyltransferase, partial [Burkholderiaceae bacterium]
IYTENCEPNTVIMHPLPRYSSPDANELDTDMNENPNLAIYRQTDNGLLVRMALISLILGVDQTLSDYDEDISWVSSKKSN